MELFQLKQGASLVVEHQSHSSQKYLLVELLLILFWGCIVGNTLSFGDWWQLCTRPIPWSLFQTCGSESLRGVVLINRIWFMKLAGSTWMAEPGRNCWVLMCWLWLLKATRAGYWNDIRLTICFQVYLRCSRHRNQRNSLIIGAKCICILKSRRASCVVMLSSIPYRGWAAYLTSNQR